jgi:hypothetical protein
MLFFLTAGHPPNLGGVTTAICPKHIRCFLVAVPISAGLGHTHQNGDDAEIRCPSVALAARRRRRFWRNSNNGVLPMQTHLKPHKAGGIALKLKGVGCC